MSRLKEAVSAREKDKDKPSVPVKLVKPVFEKYTKGIGSKILAKFGFKVSDDIKLSVMCGNCVKRLNSLPHVHVQ